MAALLSEFLLFGPSNFFSPIKYRAILTFWRKHALKSTELISPKTASRSAADWEPLLDVVPVCILRGSTCSSALQNASLQSASDRYVRDQAPLLQLLLASARI